MADFARQINRGTFNNESNLKRDVTKGIDLIEEIMFNAPLAQFLMSINRKKTTVRNPKHEWFRDSITDPVTAVTTTATTSATSFTLPLDEIGHLNNGDVLFNANTGEYARIIAAITTDGAGNVTAQLTSGTAGQSWTAADEIITLGNANTEGASDPTGSVTEKTSLYNYCEDIKTPLAITDWAMEQATEDGVDRLAFERRKKMIEHMLVAERKVILGRRDTGTVSGATWYTMGGLIDADCGVPEAQRLNLSGAAMDIDTFEDTFLGTIWGNGGSAKKSLFCSSKGISAINKMYRKDAVFQMDASTKTFGAAARGIVTGFGQAEIIHHPMLDKLGSRFGAMIICIDPAHIRMVDYGSLGGVKLLKDRQNNDEDAYEETLRSFVGLRLGIPEAHGLIYNFTVPSLS